MGNRWATDSERSHVGMILENSDGQLNLFESTKEDGVVINPLNTVLNNYDGSFSLRRLHHALTNIDLLKLEKFIPTVLGRPYERSVVELIGAARDTGPVLQNQGGHLSSLFCSELIAEAYKSMGLLLKRPSHKYAPKDFSSKATAPSFRCLFGNAQKILSRAELSRYDAGQERQREAQQRQYYCPGYKQQRPHSAFMPRQVPGTEQVYLGLPQAAKRQQLPWDPNTVFSPY